MFCDTIVPNSIWAGGTGIMHRNAIQFAALGTYIVLKHRSAKRHLYSGSHDGPNNVMILSYHHHHDQRQCKHHHQHHLATHRTNLAPLVPILFIWSYWYTTGGNLLVSTTTSNNLNWQRMCNLRSICLFCGICLCILQFSQPQTLSSHIHATLS